MNGALLAVFLASGANAACPWTKAGPDVVFENDQYGVLTAYLQRARASLALSTPSLSGFGELSAEEAEKIQGTLMSQGMAFDGSTPVFSWRYGLRRAGIIFHPGITRALAIPEEIQKEHYDPAKKNGFSHIGDIDIADGRLYAPIEDEDNRTKPTIALFDPKTLEYSGEKHLLPEKKLPHGVPWIAVDAKKGVFYTMDWDAPDLQVYDLKTYRFKKSVALKTPIKRVQGGKVRDGLLYLSSDSNDEVVKGLKRKRVYEVDPATGKALEILSFDEPDRAETEGLAFAPDGTLYLIALAPYFYDERFPESLELNGDDWNPSARLITYRREECK